MVSAISSASISERQQTRPPRSNSPGRVCRRPDAGPGPSLLGQHHLPSLVDGDDGLDLIGDLAISVGGATRFVLLLGWPWRPPVSKSPFQRILSILNSCKPSRRNDLRRRLCRDPPVGRAIFSRLAIYVHPNICYIGVVSNTDWPSPPAIGESRNETVPIDRCRSNFGWRCRGHGPRPCRWRAIRQRQPRPGRHRPGRGSQQIRLPLLLEGKRSANRQGMGHRSAGNCQDGR